MECTIHKFQIEKQLLGQTATSTLAQIIEEIANNREMVDFILSFSDERIADALHKLWLLSSSVGVRS